MTSASPRCSARSGTRASSSTSWRTRSTSACPTYNKRADSRFMEFSNGQVKSADRSKTRRNHAESRSDPAGQGRIPADDRPGGVRQGPSQARRDQDEGLPRPEDRAPVAQGIRGLLEVRQAHEGPVRKPTERARSRLHLFAVWPLGQAGSVRLRSLPRGARSARISGARLPDHRPRRRSRP